MTRLTLLALLLTSVAAPAEAHISYVHAGRLIDPAQGRVLIDQLIRIRDGRIAAVTAWSTPPSDGPVTDWSGKTVLPGLIDAHTHIADVEQTSNDAEPLLHTPQETAFIGAAHARATLRAGFTTVHDVGCYRGLSDVALRNAINAGIVPGPRMNVVGAYITIPHGGGEVTGLPPGMAPTPDMRMGVVTSPAEVRRAVDNLFDHGVDSIKLIATGAVLAEGTEPGTQELTEAEMRAAVEEAAKYHSFAVAHAHGAAGIKAAIRAGVRSIEHASLIDDEGLLMAKSRGIFLDMDIYDGDYIEAVGTREQWPASELRKNRDTTDAQRAAFRKAVQMGIRLSFGTDAGVFPHGTQARQFAIMVRYGMTPMQAIQAATTQAAALLGWQRDVGGVAPGQYADLVAVDGDPLRDISVLEHMAGVMKGGEVVK